MKINVIYLLAVISIMACHTQHEHSHDEGQGHTEKEMNEDDHDDHEEEIRITHEQSLNIELGYGSVEKRPLRTLVKLNGQIELLLVGKDHKVAGWICENCQAVDSGVKKECPYCGKRTSEVDVIEEIIEFAERMDTKIEFVDDNPTLDELGGIGGLLRYK